MYHLQNGLFSNQYLKEGSGDYANSKLFDIQGLSFTSTSFHLPCAPHVRDKISVDIRITEVRGKAKAEYEPAQYTRQTSRWDTLCKGEHFTITARS